MIFLVQTIFFISMFSNGEGYNIWLQGVQTVKAQLTDLQADVLLFESLHAEFMFE